MTREELIKMLPEGYEKACWETKAMNRKRGLQIEKDLLTLCIFYCCDHSLVEVQSYAKAANIYDISDVGFMKRFSRCGDWFDWIIENLTPSEIMKYSKPEILEKYHILAVDATDVTSGGKATQKWHIHYALDLFTLTCSEFKLTPETTGESLTNFEFEPNDLVIGDRAYASLKGIEYCQKCGADFVLRIKNKAFKMYTENGEEVTFSDILKDVGSDIKNFKIFVRSSNKEMVPLRICAVKKDSEALKSTEKKMRRKESKKQMTYSVDTKFVNQFFFVITSLDETFTAEQILNLYKLRWQVEMVFKRYKSILKLGSMPTKTYNSSKAWLSCKMLIVLIMEKLLSDSDFSPSASEDEELVEGMKIVYSWILTGIFSLDMLVFQDIFESVSLICCVEKRRKRRHLQMSEIRLG